MRTCIRTCLYRAHKLGDVKTISIPAISSGVYGCPKDVCAEIIITSCVRWLAKIEDDCKIETIRLCNFDQPTVDAFQDKLIELYKKKKATPSDTR